MVEIIYQPQAIFRVQAVTRCTSTIAGILHKVMKSCFLNCWKVKVIFQYLIIGHAEAVISLAFSPCGR